MTSPRRIGATGANPRRCDMFVEPPAAQTHEQAALFPVQQPRPLSSRRVAPVQRYGVCRPMKLVLEAELP